MIFSDLKGQALSWFLTPRLGNAAGQPLTCHLQALRPEAAQGGIWVVSGNSPCLKAVFMLNLKTILDYFLHKLAKN